MSRRLTPLVILAAFALASCGGSSHHPGSTAGASSASSTSQTSSGSQTATSTTPAAPTPTSTAPGPGTPGSTGSAPAGGEERIRIPANFTIRAGGRLSPSSVSSPAFLALELSVASGDGRSHRVLVRTPKPHSLLVKARRRASALIRGLPPGHYRIAVDGNLRGVLNIGGEPGP